MLVTPFIFLSTFIQPAFRAISAFPTGFAVKPGTLAALGPSLLRLSGQPPKVAFQQRWNFNSSYQNEGYNQGNDRQNNRGNDSFVPKNIHKPNDTIYVGNLFFEVTAEDLQRDLAKFGTVHSARIIYDSRGLSRGFAYVQFDSIEAAEKAITELNMTVYEGRRIVVNYSSRGAAVPRTRAAEPTKTLFVGNLSFEMTDRELNELFKDVPGVRDVRVSVDKRTGKPRGFAHADFYDIESAKAGMELLREKSPYGRPLRLDFSHNRQDMPGFRRNPRPAERVTSEAAETQEATYEFASEPVSENASEPASESAR
ncbi:hypothetical protein GX51_04087 [Blastomyces parvus]|uniref:RRM domain-containing protein n=1 Tax=Blastomyces parvus TaxID=2060905 RepID=A0A2B7X2T5_9EURO|nr:hypothetical protein GX51_04087 [Blastomyces parvus]